MTQAVTIDGKKISALILAELDKEIQKLSFKPKLIDILIGEDPVSESYVRIKAKRSDEIGLDFQVLNLPEKISQLELTTKITELQKTEENLAGLIIQLPMPEHLHKQEILDLISPDLDVDVVTSINLGKLFTGQEYFIPATAGAILAVLDDCLANFSESGLSKPSLAGKKVLVVGAGDLVGKPITFLLLQRNATVIVANSSTTNLSELGQQCDIIISGAGVPNLIKAEMVKPGAIVIDAGTAESAGGISGDVDFDAVYQKAAFISPVPGGLGPVTVAMLLKNTVLAAQKCELSQSKVRI